MRSSIPLPFAALLGFVGSALCIWGLWAAWRSERRFLATAVSTTGVVESLRVHANPRSMDLFPVVRFTTADGTSVSAVSKSTRPDYVVGQRVTVDYDPSDPRQMEVHSWWSHWAALGVLAVFAVFLLWVGVTALQQMAAA